MDAAYSWLLKEQGPKVLLEAIKLYGVAEIKGPRHNAQILKWADEINPTVGAYYDQDEKAWCALFVSICLKRAGYVPPSGFNAIRALPFAHWGVPIKSPSNYGVGDIAVFARTGGGHVGFMVGQDRSAYHILGGNQKDKVGIDRIAKDRLKAVVRCPFKTFKPRLLPALRDKGSLSYDEA